jgi:carotenoid 1,2-hydratase
MQRIAPAQPAGVPASPASGHSGPVAVALYTPPAHADAWHQVRAPGGYEWWYFDADDVEHDRHMVAILFDGFVFHPGYLRAYFRYRRNPTRMPPPLPQDFRCAYFVLYEAGRIRWQFMTQLPTIDFRAATDRPEVSIGPNRMWQEQGSLHLQLRGTPWHLTWRGPRRDDSHHLEAEFSFTPRHAHAPAERIFLSRELAGAEHHWVIANPLCDVRGTVRVGADSLAFGGRGYHDHNYGTGPLGPGLQRWLWGRALPVDDDSACTFHFARPRDRSLADEVHLVEVSRQAMTETPIRRVSCDWSLRTGTRLAYPAQLRMDDVLELRNPRLIDSAPFYMRLKYDALLRGRRAAALCEIACPHRLRWPVLGRMIEMSIDRTTIPAG